MNNLKNMDSRINDFEKELKRLEVVLDKMRLGIMELKEKKTDIEKPLRPGDYGFINLHGRSPVPFVIYKEGNETSFFIENDIHVLALPADFKKLGNIFDELKSKMDGF